MKVTFDSNAWQRVVQPERFAKDPRNADFVTIHSALQSGHIEGFIVETVATIEAIPKMCRDRYLGSCQPPVSVEAIAGEGSLEITIAGRSEDHPGLSPVLTDRLQAAYALGMKLIPSPRIGMPRPLEIEKAPKIPLTEDQEANIWPLLERNDALAQEIETRGVGRARLEAIAMRIRQRLDCGPEAAWFDGLDQPQNDVEKAEIQSAFAEWADGDSIALHIAYGVDVFCTEDQGRSTRRSILDAQHRAWLSNTYGVNFSTLPELATRLGGGEGI